MGRFKTAVAILAALAVLWLAGKSSEGMHDIQTPLKCSAQTPVGDEPCGYYEEQEWDP